MAERKTVVNFTCDTELLDRLDAACAKARYSRSEALREGIDLWLRSQARKAK